ncbi:MAG: AmmeMemoRadiSam system radical SAM enzyme [Dehalococcoidia bacterium]|nr:AmmeMemoRadiSam system radical SAM enzyme [Dehalococcoidia bacterium]
MKEALFYKKDSGGFVVCGLCPHSCRIPAGGIGLCGARMNDNGTLIAESYGQITSLNLDPIEKKPLRRFYPGSMILSAGNYGCNMKCAYCQNHSISQGKPETKYVSPEELLRVAKVMGGNLGIAFTYNEPLISIEYVLETALLFREAGLKVILITNGMINPEPLKVILAHVDAMNIDVKAFSSERYGKLSGDLAAVKNTVECSAALCHVEITSLIVPWQNDGVEDMQSLAEWLAGISPEIAFHISRFFPCNKMTDCSPTPIDTMKELAAVAQKSLKYVYLGNV